MNRIFRYTIFYLLVFLVIIGVVGYFNNNNQPTKNITYNEFISHLENNDVKSFSMQPERGVYEVRGQLKGDDGNYFQTYVMNSDTLLNRIDNAARTPEWKCCLLRKLAVGSPFLLQLFHF